MGHRTSAKDDEETQPQVRRRHDSVIAAGVPPVSKEAKSTEVELPTGWKKYHSDEHNRPYYYNKELAKTSWTVAGIHNQDEAKGSASKDGAKK